MAHKITLTGTPTSKLRTMGNKKDVFSFDMREKGSPSGTKGLPKSEGIDYTVFINKKQFNKLKIEPREMKTIKILIQGEPTLNVPINECPGEIGVICMQAQIIEPKEDKPEPKAEKKPNPEPEKEAPKVEPNPEPEPKTTVPTGTIDLIQIDNIVVPDHFKKFQPRYEKLVSKMEYIEKNGTLEKPVTIEKETNILTDGYASFLAAMEKKMVKVPVRY